MTSREGLRSAMLFRQVIHEDLGCASYLVGDVGEGIAAVVDPQWDIEPYLHLSRLHGVRIEHVLETHNHADHVSGHGRLARATGATIHIHRLADAEYPHEAFDDGWILRLGAVEIEAVAHPRPPARAHRLRAARPRLRRRADRRAERRLAVRRRRRAPRPRGRARGGRARSLPIAERAAVHAPGQRRGLARAPGRLAVRRLGDRPPDLVDDRLRARAQPRRRVRRPPTSSPPTRSRRSGTARPTSNTSSTSTAARWSRSSVPRRRSAPAPSRSRSPAARCSSTRAPTISSTRRTSPVRSAPRPTTPVSRPRSPRSSRRTSS